MITAIIADANEPSIAVAARLGMNALRVDHLFDHDVTVFATHAP